MKKLNFIFVFLIMMTLGVFGLFFFSRKNSYSLLEDRHLTSKPTLHLSSLSNRSIIDALEMYYQDHFLFRSSFLEQGVKIQKLLGIYIQNQVYIGKDGFLLKQPVEVKKANTFIHKMNQFYKDHNDFNISLILLPSHVTVNPNKAPKTVSIFDEYRQMKSIYHQVTVNTIDVVPTLKNGLSDYEMFYHLDSNLTSYGAYYVYKEFTHLNDLQNIPIQEFEIEEVTNSFAGNLVKKTYTFSDKKDSIVRFIPKEPPKLEVLYPDKTLTTFYDESALKNNMYHYFLGKEVSNLVIINKSIQNQKEILIVKDESANAIIPFLTNHYYKVHVIDTKWYHSSMSEYLENNQEIKDVLWIYHMNGLDETIKNLLL